jgi:hypothetical protein
MTDTITTLHAARSSLGAVRQLLEQLDDPELLLSTKLAEVQVDIGQRLDRLYSEANAAAVGPQKGRWDS